MMLTFKYVELPLLTRRLRFKWTFVSSSIITLVLQRLTIAQLPYLCSRFGFFANLLILYVSDPIRHGQQPMS